MNFTTQYKTEQRELSEYQNWREKCRSRGYFWEVERIDIINHLINKFNYVNYLEIGVNDGSCFKKIKAKYKNGVDPGIELFSTTTPGLKKYRPVFEVDYPITSNKFFELISSSNIKYDIIFIDGLHHDYQVYEDIKNAFNHITENGTIVCHDMNPQWEICQRKAPLENVGSWNGNCWRAWIKLRSELKNYKMEVVDTDHGVGIIQKGKQECLKLSDDAFNLEFWYLSKNRKSLLNLITIEEFYKKYD